MQPSEARRRLLAQHDHLRGLLRAALQLRAAMATDAPVPGELMSLLDQLNTAFAEHNQLEHTWLEPLLRSGDAWAPARIARMLEEHEAEHVVFARFFAGWALEMVDGLPALAEEIESHMAAEERTFLSRAVLRDDLVTDGQSG